MNQDLKAKYPKWTLIIRRAEGLHLKGICGCGWESEEFLRTVHVAEAWDAHMTESVFQDPGLHRG